MISKKVIGICSAAVVVALGAGITIFAVNRNNIANTDRLISSPSFQTEEVSALSTAETIPTAEASAEINNETADTAPTEQTDTAEATAPTEESAPAETSPAEYPATAESANSEESTSTTVPTAEVTTTAPIPEDTTPAETPVQTAAPQESDTSTSNKINSKSDQELDIGEINSQGYEVIGITSTGTRYIAIDEKWETKGWAIIGYDSNGNPQYTMDHAKATEINQEKIDAGVKWMEENNVSVNG